MKSASYAPEQGPWPSAHAASPDQLKTSGRLAALFGLSLTFVLTLLMALVMAPAALLCRLWAHDAQGLTRVGSNGAGRPKSATDNTNAYPECD